MLFLLFLIEMFHLLLRAERSNDKKPCGGPTWKDSYESLKK